MGTGTKHTVLFFVRRIGPYHHARFLAAARLLDLAVIETRPDSQEYPWEKDEFKGYEVSGFTGSQNAETGLKGIFLKQAVARGFDKYKPDVVVTTGWADHEYHVAVMEAHRRKIPCIVISDSRRQDVPRKFYSEFLKTLILKSFSAAIVAGTQSKEYLVRLGFNSAAIFKPWDVVDNDYFAQHTSGSAFDERYFLCVSRFIEKKNLPALIDAFAMYRSVGGKRGLVIAGDGPMSEQLRKQVAFLDIEGLVRFPGFVQYDGMGEILSGAYGLILPSVSDQWGLVVNEAMASGLPVLVSSACGCAADIVKDSVNGFVIDAHSTDSIAAALTKLDKSGEQQWREMGRASRDIISQWKTDDFAIALRSSTEYAMSNRVVNAFPFLHRVLGSR